MFTALPAIVVAIADVIGAVCDGNYDYAPFVVVVGVVAVEFEELLWMTYY